MMLTIELKLTLQCFLDYLKTKAPCRECRFGIVVAGPAWVKQ